MHEVFEKLCKLKGISAYRFCKDTGVNSSTISTWKKKNSLAGPELAQIVCDYFGISLDYLMTGKETSEKEEDIATRDNRDISRDIRRIMYELEHDKDGPLYYEGEPLDDNNLFLLRTALESAMDAVKKKKKERKE